MTVRLIQATHNPDYIIDKAGRVCYNSETESGPQREEWIKTRIKQGHLSILEHASVTFEIKCSRACSHELVRHRLASYSQRSQRYVDEGNFEYYTPPELKKSPRFAEIIANAQMSYRMLLDEGIKKEIARYILPNAIMTEIIMTMNFRELRHFIKLRTDKAAMPEMRELALEIREICRGLSLACFGDL